MWHRWLDRHGQKALTTAVAHVEAASAVELAIAIRRHARAWPHVSFIAAALAAWVTLALMMFSEPAFALWSFVVDPFVAGAAAACAATVMPPLVRWLTPARVLRRAVRTAANATFVDRRVHDTRGRTGVLVYCALAERMAAVVVDRSVANAVPAATLRQWQDQIERSMAGGAQATAEAIVGIAPRFAAALPRLADDENELADAVEHDLDGTAWQ
jgi:putative membrane protein